ncbi:JMJD6 [Mytilus coruscus]|uniref:JMJD6 n=1 Tax=Mytilus coruscus TaxID=42192 RepID=A0A6J7ZYD9_MYTCO|nr:JMJD6 [Mytilus coruscus]
MKRQISKELLQAERLAKQMESEELVTPLRLLLVLIISVVLVTAVSFSAASTSDYLLSSSYETINLTSVPYIYDYLKAEKTREENMEFYNQPLDHWTVEKRSRLSLDEFWDIYDGKWPVIITDVVDKWPAINWTKRFFLQNYAEEKVMVKAVVNSKPAAVAVDMDTFISELDTSGPNGWTYLEDELFIVTRPELKKDIGPNVYSEENFFNLFPDEVRPWDFYTWTLTTGLLQMLYCMDTSPGCPIDAFEPDSIKYPNFDKAQYLEVTVSAGEMLIIPTGWYHQAFNEEETLAISSQVMNRNNYLAVLEEIIKGGNINRKKLPAYFNTLLPPDQVKLFLSLLHKKILKKGKEVTEGVLKDMHRKKVLNI